jgi:hypothetical protein
MSGWNKTTTKPTVTGLSASDIYMVDEAECAATDGIAQPGWVHVKTVGSRKLYETLVAMADPSTDTEYEAAGGADDDSEFADS